MILTETLPLPTGAAQTYSWDGKNPTKNKYVTPDVYQVTISVVRDPKVANSKPVATVTHQITVFKVDCIFVQSDTDTTEIEPQNVTFTADIVGRQTNLEAGGEDLIRCRADIKPDSLDDTYNPRIEWYIEDNPDDGANANSGDPNDLLPDSTANPPPDRTNATLQAVAPAAAAGRNYHLRYRIQARLGIAEGTKTFTATSDWKTIRQDARDYIRQQYMDIDTSSNSRTIYRPSRGTTDVNGRTRGLVDESGFTALVDFPFRKFKCQGRDYCINHAFHWDNTVAYVFQQVRNEHGEINLTSAFRCPRHNKNPSVGGFVASRHMAGDAFDFDNIGVDSVEGVGTTEKERNWAVAQSANDAGVPAASILLYSKGGGKYKSLQELKNADPPYSATNIPEGWGNTYEKGHVSTNAWRRPQNTQ